MVASGVLALAGGLVTATDLRAQAADHADPDAGSTESRGPSDGGTIGRLASKDANEAPLENVFEDDATNMMRVAMRREGDQLQVGRVSYDAGGSNASGSGLQLGTPDVDGPCSRSNVRRVVEGEKTALKYCLERQLGAFPDMSGEFVVRWTIGSQGQVTSTSTTSSAIPSSEGLDCIELVIERARFKPPESKTCDIEYPMTFPNP